MTPASRVLVRWKFDNKPGAASIHFSPKQLVGLDGASVPAILIMIVTWLHRGLIFLLLVARIYQGISKDSEEVRWIPRAIHDPALLRFAPTTWLLTILLLNLPSIII